MATVYLGSPAHIDAGKTPLAERLLCAAGLIGSVAPLRPSALNVRLLDTLGHGDAIAAIPRSPQALGGAAAIGAGVR